MLEEDSYLIKKVHHHLDDGYDIETEQSGSIDHEWYEMYIGIGAESRKNTIEFRCSCVSKEELFMIKSWAEDFLELAKVQTKAEINKMFESEADEYDCDPKWFREHIRVNYPNIFMCKIIQRGLHTKRVLGLCERESYRNSNFLWV